MNNKWTCMCGNVNANYVSTCSCGRDKKGKTMDEKIEEMKINKGYWRCQCGILIEPNRKKCSCGYVLVTDVADEDENEKQADNKEEILDNDNVTNAVEENIKDEQELEIKEILELFSYIE